MIKNMSGDYHDYHDDDVDNGVDNYGILRHCSFQTSLIIE